MAKDPFEQHSPADFPTLTAPGTTPVLTSIFQCSAEFLGQLKLHLEQNPPSVPITSILGFEQFTIQPAITIATNETTSSTTYADLATTGPTLTGLSNGKYAIFFGCILSVTGGATQYMSVDVNGAGAADGDGIQSSVATTTTQMRLILKTLSNGNNTLTSKYKCSSGAATASFANRWLLALKYSNS